MVNNRSDGLLGKTPPHLIGDKTAKNDIFFAAVEMTRMPMLLTDPNLPDNPVVFCNIAFSELTGYSEDEVIGRNCRFLQGEGTDPKTLDQIRQSLENKSDCSVEILNYRKDGSAFWNGLFISPVYDSDKNLKFFFASQLDVTRRHDAEEALRQAQKMEAVGQLTGGLAHDFNNMLTVIMGNIEQAQMVYGTDRQKVCLERSMDAAKKAERLTAQLLAFARQQTLDLRSTNINSLAANMHELVQRTLGSHINVVTAFAPKIDLAMVDAVQAETALLNILINARDAMPNGGTVTIETRNETIKVPPSVNIKPGDYVVMSIRDTGMGISKENLARVTEPFFTTKEVGKGTGMGLAMVYGLMRQSHGFLHIESEVGVGTKVELHFPSIGIPESLEGREVKRADTLLKQGQGETILVVEDNIEVMEIARDVFEENGYRVLTATMAKVAEDILENQNIDLLFSDVIMPGGMTGLELARTARIKYPNLKIILATGWADQQEISSNEFELLKKPYLPSSLLERAKKVLEGVHDG